MSTEHVSLCLHNAHDMRERLDFIPLAENGGCHDDEG
jgi:hypothetical protein